MSPGNEVVGEETSEDDSSAFSAAVLEADPEQVYTAGLTIIVLPTMIAVASTIATPRPLQRVAVRPLVTWPLVCRHSLVRRAGRDNPQEQHSREHHAECTKTQEQQQASRVVRESDTGDKSEQESAQAKSAQRECRRRSSMAWPVGGTRLDRSAERTATSNTRQEAKKAQQAD